MCKLNQISYLLQHLKKHYVGVAENTLVAKGRTSSEAIPF